MAGSGPTFTILTTFPTGVFPGAPPVQGTDGNFYGTATAIYPAPATIYRVTPEGVLSTIYNFCSQPGCADGSGSEGGLVLGSDGNFYGTSLTGGANNWGTVFRITPAGVLTTLHSFTQTDGALPCSTMIQANSGEFYGTTGSGGYNYDGTIFKITPQGALTTVYSFATPWSATLCASLLQAANGNFYGTTANDGNFGGPGDGTIFELTPAGTFSTLYTFTGKDGAFPQDGLLPTNGDFYGTTAEGGADAVGTVFQFAPDGTLTTLYSFGGSSGCPDGCYPYAPLVLASNGKFYGTATIGGGSGGDGTIFEITTAGTLIKMYGFRTTDGQPYGGLIQGTDGAFYGTATHGTNGDVFYRLTAGLPPLIKPVPLSGAAGSVVTILGTNLSGTTSVTFNGVAAAFTVVSASAITGTVPARAGTGKIRVVTPGGTLSTVGAFVVTH